MALKPRPLMFIRRNDINTFQAICLMYLLHEAPNMSRARSSLRPTHGTSFGICQEKTTDMCWVQNPTRQRPACDPSQTYRQYYWIFHQKGITIKIISGFKYLEATSSTDSCSIASPCIRIVSATATLARLERI